MIRKLLLVLTVCLAVVSCKQNDIALYNGAPRLEFTSNISCIFDDTDYVNKVAEKDFEAEIRLIGLPLSDTKTYAMLCVAHPLYGEGIVPEITFSNPYTFPVEKSVIKAAFKVKRPKNVRASHVGRLAFDMENAQHEFEAGRKEHTTPDIEVRTNINQHGIRWSWNQDLWGLYSTNKYIFMMDNLGKTYDQIPQTTEEVIKVGKLYQEYRKNNPPLLDDEKDASEIYFPTH
ncbi:hypothetical protein [Porphyromonas sp.]|uniref:hypothetical protein n=1 Tax=Porphyromonas sp. TaxID=1924944 RepID=UPI0026DB26E8|nr:hypothetical protein [Porphyromonas sp.]MDO4770839.1 hypothetical protein [Porphyromonas sp.]